MSIVSALQNKNRVIRSTVTTPTVKSGSTTRLFVTVPNLPVACRIRTVRVVASASVDSLTATIVSDAGAYFRASGATAKAQYIVEQRSYGEGATQVVVFAFNDVDYFDAREVGCVYVILDKDDNLPNGATFTVTVEVEPSLYLPEQLPLANDHSFRVLRVPASGTTEDLTTLALRNGDPYTQGGVNNSATFDALLSSTDTLLVGSAAPLKGVLVSVRDLDSYKGVVECRYSVTGGAWSAGLLATEDNTSDNQATSPSGLTYTGTIRLTTAPNDWVARTISTDPNTIQQLLAQSDGKPAYGPNPPRYWLQFKATGLSGGPLKLVGIQPLK